MIKKTTDSYEAAYYMTLGAVVSRISSRTISDHKAKRLGFKKQWIMTLDNVPKWAVMGWNESMGYVQVHKFKKARLKLKKLLTS